MKKIFSFTLVLLFPLFLNSQIQAKISSDFKKYNLNGLNQPEKWEDGMRTTGERGTFEWWYFDAHLDDGSTAVIVFLTKHYNKMKKPLLPMIKLDITKPDGTHIKKRIEYDDKLFLSSKDSCNVQIDKNYFIGNLKEYEIHFEDADLNLTAKIKRTTESWRPKTGYMEFGENTDEYFAWLVAVPGGLVEMEYTYAGNKHEAKGTCYHDHNWGNKNLVELFNHWYWTRTHIGPYTVIASEMITEDEYNNESIVVYDLSKNGKTIADNDDLVKAYRTHGKMHPKLDKDISDNLLFVYEDPKTNYRYEYSLSRKKTIVETDLLLNALGSKNLKYRLIRCLTGFDGAYFRFTGTSSIKVYEKDKLIESYSGDEAIWELMYFGKP